jgi:hypothetical protein
MKTLTTISKLFLTTVILCTGHIFAQEKTIQGKRLPCLTTVQRNQIPVAGNPSAKGLSIFNTDEARLEIWNGNEWICAWLSNGNDDIDSTNYLGTNNAADLVIKTNSNERMRIDKDGNVFLKHVCRAHDDVAQLAIDNATGEIFAIKTETNVNPMNYLQYVITTADGDWIKSFNTKIPVDDYTLIIVGSSFKHPKTAALKLNPRDVAFGTFVSQEVLAFEEKGTWRLRADYVDAATGDGTPGTWTIYCIAINNSLVKKFEPQVHIMTSVIDAAPCKPASL